MLVEIKSPVFKENGKERPTIAFKEGLNVVLGKEDGENSIGKSSAMLAIDFVFGGNTYLESDGIKHVGDHTIYFAFEFDGTRYHFARTTGDAENVQICDKGYNLTGNVWTKAKYVEWLKEKYKIGFEGLSFRMTLSSFFRIYGKENLDERRPLKGLPGQNMQSSIEVLIKLFDRYKEIKEFDDKMVEHKNKLQAFRAAQKYDFVPELSGGKKQYEENLAAIQSLQYELDHLTEQQVTSSNEADIEKGKQLSELKAQQVQVESQIMSQERRLKLIDMSQDYGLYPTESDLSALQEFFPGVNLRKIYEIEKYHKKLAAILQGQFDDEKKNIVDSIENLQGQLAEIQAKIKQLGYVGKFSKEFLDKHSEIQGKITAIKAQNESYLTLQELINARRITDQQLKKAIDTILMELEDTLNSKMKELNDSLFDDARKAPTLHLKEYNSYDFETPDDTGTGSNYKGMVIYDLAVLQCTDLPAIAHDSLILKNISDVAINGIMKIYAESTKQVFIAFDKQDAYGPEVQKILSDNMVLKLSNNGAELYGESWNKEEK